MKEEIRSIIVFLNQSFGKISIGIFLHLAYLLFASLFFLLLVILARVAPVPILSLGLALFLALSWRLKLLLVKKIQLPLNMAFVLRTAQPVQLDFSTSWKKVSVNLRKFRVAFPSRRLKLALLVIDSAATPLPRDAVEQLVGFDRKLGRQRLLVLLLTWLPFLLIALLMTLKHPQLSLKLLTIGLGLFMACLLTSMIIDPITYLLTQQRSQGDADKRTDSIT